MLKALLGASQRYFFFVFFGFFLCPVFFFHRFLEVAVGSTGVWWCCCCPCCFGCRCRLCLLKFIHPRTFYIFHGRRVFCFGVLLNRRRFERLRPSLQSPAALTDGHSRQHFFLLLVFCIFCFIPLFGGGVRIGEWVRDGAVLSCPVIFRTFAK